MLLNKMIIVLTIGSGSVFQYPLNMFLAVQELILQRRASVLCVVCCVLCVVCCVLCVVCICVVAQVKISHEADAVPIRIKKLNHRNSVAQMRLQRHTAEYRKQNIPKTLLGLVPALLDFRIHLL